MQLRGEGSWQFVKAIRSRWPAFHRRSGRTYMVAVAVGGVSDFVIAWTSISGPIARGGFATLAVIWLYVTGKGYQTARAGWFVEHRHWMIRSFALTAAAITLRLGLPIAPALGYDFQTGYIILSWACWIFNLTLEELYLRRGFRSFSAGEKNPGAPQVS